MSAEKTIFKFLKEDLFFQEAFGGILNPLSINTNKVIKLRKNSDDTEDISKNRDLVRKNAIVSIDSLDKDIFQEVGKGEDTKIAITSNPIKKSDKAPKNVEESKNMLKIIYIYLSGKAKSLKWLDVDKVYDFILGWFIKFFGIAGSSITVYKISEYSAEKIQMLRGKNDNPATLKFFIMTLIPLMTLILCIYVIFDSIKKSEDPNDPSKKLDLKESTKNILHELSISALGKISNRELRWATLSTIIAVITYVIVTNNPIMTKLGSIASVLGKQIGEISDTIINRIKKIKS